MAPDSNSREADEWRLPTEAETQILGKLLSKDFPGRAELMHQFGVAEVRTIDGTYSFEVRTCSSETAFVKRTVPVEGEFEDTDGITGHILLFIRDGIMEEVQLYKEDGGCE
jgi:hypothetical protein